MKDAVFLTGATGAIGREIALWLARNGYPLVLACRSEDRGRQLARDLVAEGSPGASCVRLDLSDPCSVREAVRETGGIPLSGIINNAGIMNRRFVLCPDGHEATLEVNYHNTRLLTELLLPSLSPGGSVVFTTSATRRWYPFQRRAEDIGLEQFSRMRAYALSKKLVTEYACGLSVRLAASGVRVNCADPGVVDTPMLHMDRWYDGLTDILFRPLCLSPSTGAKAAIRAFTSSSTGRIYMPVPVSVRVPSRLFFR